ISPVRRPAPPDPTTIAISSAVLRDAAPRSTSRSLGRSDRGNSRILNDFSGAGLDIEPHFGVAERPRRHHFSPPGTNCARYRLSPASNLSCRSARSGKSVLLSASKCRHLRILVADRLLRTLGRRVLTRMNCTDYADRRGYGV